MIGRLVLTSGSVLAGVYLGSKYSDKVEFAEQKLNAMREQFVRDYISGKESNDVDSKLHLASAKHLMRKAVAVSRNSGKFAVLSTTSSTDGHVSSRLIQPFATEFDPLSGLPVIYFNTNKLSRKCQDMKKCPDVTLTFTSEKNMSCVAFRGKVRQVPYPQSTQHWNDSLYLFYPEGSNEEKGSRFTVWALEPQTIQMVSVGDGIVSERDDWKPPEISLDTITKSCVMVCNGQDSLK